jgi:hypothetical protein
MDIKLDLRVIRLEYPFLQPGEAAATDQSLII